MNFGMSKNYKITLATLSDIATDQRIQRIARTLSEEGYDVKILSRKIHKRHSNATAQYSIVRRKIWFKKGFLMYANYNIMLFIQLLFAKTDVITANDLDTLTACALVAFLRRKPLVYDSHELFTGLPELNKRPMTRKIWSFFEHVCIKKTVAQSTVCESIAKELENKYGKPFVVVRNVPHYASGIDISSDSPRNEKILIYQGSLNMGRGIEIMIKAMQYLDGFTLVIAGTGYLENTLRKLTAELNLNHKVTFTGLLSPSELKKLTSKAQLGLSLEEDICVNYKYALPNKLFDYIQARVPVLTSNLPEMKRITEKYKIGTSIEVTSAEELANIINNIFEHSHVLSLWKNNCSIAASDLCWEKEKHKIVHLYKEIIPS